MQVVNGVKVTHQMTLRWGDRPDDLVWSCVITVFIRGEREPEAGRMGRTCPALLALRMEEGAVENGAPGSQWGPGTGSPLELPKQAQPCCTVAGARLDCKILSLCYLKPLSLT